MICPECNGKRSVQIPRDVVRLSGRRVLDWDYVSCPYCNGAGEIDCSEGSERGGQLPDKETSND